jgi:hypothetical protein
MDERFNHVACVVVPANFARSPGASISGNFSVHHALDQAFNLA